MKNDFQNNGFCIVKNVLSEDIKNIVINYMLFDEIQNFSPEKKKQGGGQVPEAHSKFTDPLTESMLLYLKPLIEKKTGLSLYPTYSMYRVYRNGDRLPPHKDRESCEISATLCLGYSYDDSKYQWPLFIDNREVVLGPGDLAIYKGLELDHWRESFNFPESSWQAQAFFHYVDANGKYEKFKYDGRNSIGKNHPLLEKMQNTSIQKTITKPYLMKSDGVL